MKSEDVSNDSQDELKKFRETFAADLKEYHAKEHRYAMPILMVFLAGFAAIFCSFLLFQHPVKWLFITGIGLIAAGLVLIAVVGSLLQKNLTCPACHSFFIDELAECCPECGSPGLESKNWRGARLCKSCGKKLTAGKRRNFKYKACTHCGLLLCEKGL
jgi:hypothetical protein